MQLKSSIEITASISRFAIAAAIVYFAYQMSVVNQSVPVITRSIDQISQHIEPSLEEINAISVEIGKYRELIPGVLAEVTAIRKLIPPVLEKIGEISKLMPEVVAEVTEVRKLIPSILEEIAEIRSEIPAVIKEVREVRRQIPPVLKRVDAITVQIPPIIDEVNKMVVVMDDTQQQILEILSTTDDAVASINQIRDDIVLLVPQILEEITLVRGAIDPALDRVELLVDDVYFKTQDSISSAKDAGREASEGAITGFFTGLLKLPFKLVGTLAAPIIDSLDTDVAKQLTEKDLELMADAGDKGLKSKKLNSERRWKNSKSGNSGSITVVRKFNNQSRECVEARVTIRSRHRELMDELVNYCLSEKGAWVVVEG